MKKSNLNRKNNSQKNLPDCQHIFLLSHMRANTSLISHILGSHPQINGYYEMHLSYHSQSDLINQEQLLCQNEEQNNTQRQYLFDKILHNNYALQLDKLSLKADPEKIKILISIRPPEQSIKSIINLFRTKDTQHRYANPEDATDYYIKRLKILAEFCQQYKKKYYYYDADIIRTSPKKSLAQITSWLSLSSPLKEKYKIFTLTGKPRVGDSSDNMKAGRIVKQQTNYEAIEIPSHLLDNANTEMKKCRQKIIAYPIDSMTF